MGGQLHIYDPKSVVITITEPDNNETEIPEEYGLLQNNPNPFYPELNNTQLIFNLKETSKVELNIYNIKGELIKSLYSGNINYYEASWDGKDESGKLQTTGIYLCTLSVNGKLYQTKKLILLR